MTQPIVSCDETLWETLRGDIVKSTMYIKKGSYIVLKGETLFPSLRRNFSVR